MDELAKLEEKVEKLLAALSELKQRARDSEEHNARLKARDREIKEKVDGLIEKIDGFLM